VQVFDETQLALLAGTTPDVVGRMLEHGLLPAEGETGLRPQDVQRVQLVEAFERSGIGMDAVRASIDGGNFSLAFTDVQWQASPVGAESGETYGEATARTGYPLDDLQRMFESMGFPRPEADDPIPAADVQMLPMFVVLHGLLADADVAAHVIRVYSENLRRIAQAEASFYHTYVEQPMMRSGMSEPQMRDQAVQISLAVAPMVDALVMWMYHRHQTHYVIEDLIEHLEAALERSGLGRGRAVRPPAMVFLDLAGYTRLTEERGDEAAAELAGALGDLVATESRRFGGTPVKWLGDGVMFHFPDPSGAVTCALDMVERAPQAGLPAAHVGAQAGPVIVRDGDYFGRTVNLAARIAAQAGPGEVLVGADLVADADTSALRFDHVGPVSLKGVDSPVDLYRAVRARPEPDADR
jgi:adenylate cyclase